LQNFPADHGKTLQTASERVASTSNASASM